MIIDNHVHMGWYSDGFHSPSEIWSYVHGSGIDRIVVSSTSTCVELYDNILTEFYQLISIAGIANIRPILWLTPQMLIKKWPLKRLLKSKIEWCGIKMHWLAHSRFYRDFKLVEKVLSITKTLGNVPIILHTGEWESCHAAIFSNIIEENPQINFILAHGRPLMETIDLMKHNANVWTDTAFMQIGSLQKIKDSLLSDRIMFGTDIPINRIYYPKQTTIEFLKQQISEIELIEPTILSRSIFN